MPAALAQMRRANAGDRSGAVRAASDHAGPWPTLSIWHGDADRTVDHSNAVALLDQWRPLHGVGVAPYACETVDGHRREVWRDATGREVIEAHRIDGMGHGAPLASTGADACGTPGAYMLDVGISSTRRITRFWDLESRAVSHAVEPPTTRKARPSEGPARVIEDALRAAGLMR